MGGGGVRVNGVWVGSCQTALKAIGCTYGVNWEGGWGGSEGHWGLWGGGKGSQRGYGGEERGHRGVMGGRKGVTEGYGGGEGAHRDRKSVGESSGYSGGGSMGQGSVGKSSMGHTVGLYGAG